MREYAASLIQRKRLMDRFQRLEGGEAGGLDTIDKDTCGSSSSVEGSPVKSSPVNLSPQKSALAAPSGRPTSTKGGSPRKRGDGSRSKAAKDKSPKASGEENMETFDARLKSIITAALINETPESVHESEQGLKVLAGLRQSPKKDRSPGKKDGGGRKPRSPHRAAVPKPTSQDQAKDGRYLPNAGVKAGGVEKSVSGLGIKSIPVKIPLSEVCKGQPASLPVSIPLASVADRDRLVAGGTSRDGVCKSATTGGGHRESYSPISRPSSSSSTISSESVKHLEHGARLPSPRSSSSVTTTTVGSLPPGQYSAGRAIPSAGNAASAAKPKDPYCFDDGEGPPVVPTTQMGPPPIGLCPPSGLIADKQMYLNLLKGTGRHGRLSPELAYLGLHHPNGLLKSPKADDKAKKPRRRRTSTKPSGGSNSSKKVDASLTAPGLIPCAREGGDSLHPPPDYSHNLKPGTDPPNLARTPDVAYMVSNASQPLPISAISDAESTKSSPLETTPTKAYSSVLREPGRLVDCSVLSCVIECLGLSLWHAVLPLAKSYPPALSVTTQS